jgi:hypothetical protein
LESTSSPFSRNVVLSISHEYPFFNSSSISHVSLSVRLRRIKVDRIINRKKAPRNTGCWEKKGLQALKFTLLREKKVPFNVRPKTNAVRDVSDFHFISTAHYACDYHVCYQNFQFLISRKCVTFNPLKTKRICFI